MGNEATRWVRNLGVSKSIIQGEISVGGRYFDMEEEMKIDEKDQGKLGDHSMDGTIIKNMLSSNGNPGNKKRKLYKDKSFGTWLYFEIEGCHKLGKADR